LHLQKGARTTGALGSKKETVENSSRLDTAVAGPRIRPDQGTKNPRRFWFFFGLGKTGIAKPIFAAADPPYNPPLEVQDPIV
jgi:hypothetical protein